jgi:hypothetical protein
MRSTKIPTLVSLIVLTAACAAEPEGSRSPTTTGAGGSAGGQTQMTGGSDAVGGSDGAGGDPLPPVTYEVAVGAAYKNSGDARIVLIDKTGERSSLYNPSTGAFESSDDIDELEGGIPLADVVAVANVENATYFVDSDGLVTVYDRDQATFSTPEALPEVLDDVPFAQVGAAFGAGTTLFVFNQGGTSYAAYNTANETWSQVYAFATEFGGGGAPIPSVGAAYTDEDGGYVLFDLSGTSYCVYSGSGQFSDDFDIDELGNGMLDFNDVDD